MSSDSYQALVESHLSFAESMARRFYREFRYAELDPDDVRSAAYTGLCMAAQRYKPNRGVAFKSFSYMRIRGAMLDLLRSHSNPFSNRAAVQEARAEMDHSEDVREIDRQLATLYSVLERTIDELGFSFISAGNGDVPELVYLNCGSPEDRSTASGLRRYIQNHLAQLPEKERTLLLLRYYEDQSFPEMATRLNDVRSSWLSRIHSRALERLRTMIVETKAKEWLQQVA